MTNSNGMFNPHPLANPLNTRLGPSNYTLNPCAKRSYINRSRIDVPDSCPVQFQTLEIPNQLDYFPNSQTYLRKQRTNGWGETIINFADSSNEWNDRDIYRSPIENSIDNSKINQQSKEYWNYIESQKTTEMTDLQKELLQDLESDQLMTKSKLVDVDSVDQ